MKDLENGYQHGFFSPGYLKAKNYHRYIYKNIKPFLGNRIIEIGCGPGIFSRWLQQKEELAAIDISYDDIQRLKKDRTFNDKVVFIQDDIAKFNSFSLCMQKRPDTIVCLSVLEHIEDDDKALENFYSLLKHQKGRLILFVPAFKTLYGRMDKLAGHFRRYNKKELIEKLKGSNFYIEKIFYLNSLGVVVWPLSNLLIKPDNIDEKSISLCFLFYDRFIVPVLDKVEGFAKPLFGLSIIAIGRAM